MTSMKKDERLQGIRCWLLDIDGTITLGEEALPGAASFFKRLQERSRDHIFLTNNSSHSAAFYMQRFRSLGLPASRRQILTSTDALVRYLKAIGPADRPCRVFPVGTPDFIEDLRLMGIVPVFGRRQPIDFVVLGFDTSLVYEKLDIACDYIRRGIPYLAANPDHVCPMPDGYVLPDCGALTAFMETCTETAPLKVIGKPDPYMAEMVLAEYGFDRSELAMVGDRIYTDLAFAKNAGIIGVAVLSGEASLEDITRSGIQPDFIFSSIGELADQL
jgi:4-nitrophenyl phosphatase